MRGITAPVARLVWLVCLACGPTPVSPAAAPVGSASVVPPSVISPAIVTQSPAVPRTSVPECFGPHLPLRIWAATPYAEVGFGTARGLFLIDYGTTGSTIDLGALDPRPDGSLGCYLGVDFFAPWPCLGLRASDHHGLAAPFRQAGILGTDVLSQHVYVIDYEGALLHRSAPGVFCSDEALRARGLVPLITSDWGPARDRARVNVPAVLVRIGGVSAPAQLDTGYADRVVRRSINVNRAFFEAIVASGASIERLPEHDLTLSTCVASVSEPVTAHRVAGGALAFLSMDGGVARSEAGVTVFVKETPSEARRCGGVGTWTEPAAQLGASLLEDAGLVVVDPVRGVVWLPSE